MKIIIIIQIIFLSFLGFGQSADELLKKVDQNMSSENRIFDSEMTIQGSRNSRTISSKSFSIGDKKSYTEYLSPAREMGTKMLKLENQLWIYSPSTDRIIRISGHMLRQSLMGSDLSYEDMLDDRKLSEVYSATIIGSEIVENRNTKILELLAKTDDVAYFKRKIWIDTERFVPLKEELYAKSGQLLKQSTMSDVSKIQGRWFPTRIVYKDMLKQGDGTIFKITKISFNQEIPEYLFTKAALKQ